MSPDGGVDDHQSNFNADLPARKGLRYAAQRCSGKTAACRCGEFGRRSVARAFWNLEHTVHGGAYGSREHCADEKGYCVVFVGTAFDYMYDFDTPWRFFKLR